MTTMSNTRVATKVLSIEDDPNIGDLIRANARRAEPGALDRSDRRSFERQHRCRDCAGKRGGSGWGYK